VNVKKLDDFIAACACGWFAGGIQHEIYATRKARMHVNRGRKPGHRAVAVNVSRLAVVGTYVKGQHTDQTDLLEQPPF
jgi:hypothetical protein